LQKEFKIMQKNIALVTGGNSGESVISLKSAEVISNSLDKEKYKVYTILIQGSNWEYIAPDQSRKTVDKNDFTITDNGTKIIFDCVFIGIHGTPGEDGKLQGYFDMLEIPYTFSGVLESSLTFNKHVCLALAKEYGATTAKAILLKKDEAIDLRKVVEVTGLPCFIKPVNGGSSIGMSKVKTMEELQPALDLAFTVDKEVQAEEFIDGTEVTCGILQRGKELIALPLTEIVSTREFFDYTAKYDAALAEEITPASVPEEIHKKCKEISLLLFKKFNLRGVSRFDFIIKEGTPYFLEVNTIPGMSALSIVPKQAQTMGISLGELFETLIENALQ
jgi:D-alanine-D-alanine ligase